MNNIKLILVFLITTISIIAQPLKIGDDLFKENLVQFIDQHGNLQTISKETQYLLFASDMEASKIIHPYLMKLKQEGMNSKRMAFVADIHKMPAIISKMIAIPKMKEYPYTIHLIRDETRGSYFPKEKGKITVLFLKDYKIQKIQQVGTQEELEKISEIPTAP